jgi:uncharacterized membrane protein YoaK (UPF0700 family)
MPKEPPTSAWRAYGWVAALPLLGAIVGGFLGAAQPRNDPWSGVDVMFWSAMGAGLGAFAALIAACAVAIGRCLRRREVSASSLALIVALLIAIALGARRLGLWPH